MDGLTLLAEAHAAGLKVRAEGDRLVIRGPKRAEPVARRLLEAKPVVMAVLGGRALLEGLGREKMGRISGTPSPSSPSSPDQGPCHVREALPFLAMPLDEFRTRGAMLEVRVPWLPVALWMVPSDQDVASLVAEGVHRGRIWTAAELMQLMAIADRTQETVQRLAHVKLEVDGEITEVRRR